MPSGSASTALRKRSIVVARSRWCRLRERARAIERGERETPGAARFRDRRVELGVRPPRRPVRAATDERRRSRQRRPRGPRAPIAHPTTIAAMRGKDEDRERRADAGEDDGAHRIDPRDSRRLPRNARAGSRCRAPSRSARPGRTARARGAAAGCGRRRCAPRCRRDRPTPDPAAASASGRARARASRKRSSRNSVGPSGTVLPVDGHAMRCGIELERAGGRAVPAPTRARAAAAPP